MIKKLLLGLLCLLLLLMIWEQLEQTNNEVVNNDNKDILISEALAKIGEDGNQEFLKWIYDEYGKDKLSKLAEIDNYNKGIWHDIVGKSYYVLRDLYDNKYSDIENVKIMDKTGDIMLSFIGDVSLADNWYIMPEYDNRNNGIYGILDDKIVKILNDSDIAVANNEFTISERGEPIYGKVYTFRGRKERIAIYNEMGIDLVTLANNHVYDFGGDAFNDTLDGLAEYKMPFIGAGRNITDARRPYYFVVNGYKIAFLNATRAEKTILTPEATDTSGGVSRCYDPTNLMNDIKTAKEESDFVIALIHYGREDSHSLEDEQVDSSKKYIDSGADMVIGTHAHVLQGIEFYQNKAIFYNLGDFIFNNESKDTAILQVKIDNNGNFSYYIVPAHQENEYTGLLSDGEKQRVINDINSYNINAYIDETGKVIEKNV